MDIPSRTEQQSGDVPSPRFGHTTTFLGNSKVILFGGAIGDVSHYTITADAFVCDLALFHWTKIISEKSPQARAAHAGACVDTMQLVIFGGATGGGSLSSDELYLLDLRKEPNYVWLNVPTTGASPGRRYGHTMVFNKPNLIVFGGNDGQQALNDVWFMDVDVAPFCWTEIALSAPLRCPLPRVYHSADVCREGPASGMMVVFGGRSADSKSLGDIWGLRQHRDGQWDWVEAPVKRGMVPEPRYQHTAVCMGPKMVVVGGRTETDCSTELATAVYDTELVEWRYIAPIGKFRHSSWGHKSTIFAFGGFARDTQQQPTSDLTSIDCSVQFQFYNDKEVADRKRIGIFLQQYQQQQKRLVAATPQQQNVPPQTTPITATAKSTTPLQTSAPPYASVLRRSAAPSIAATASQSTTSQPTSKAAASKATHPALHPLINIPPRLPVSDIRLSSHAFAVHGDISDFSSLVRRISIDRLEEEGKKINASAVCNIKGKPEPMNHPTLFTEIIGTLLNPGISQNDVHDRFNGDAHFCIKWKDVSALCNEVIKILKDEDTVLSLRTPIKVYGDLHGQYYDLMRFFSLYKSPIDEEFGDDLHVEGDIDSIDYLFLGDFVDRGSNSLEIICLLFALKCKYRHQLHLIRGNHEDREINSIYGFQEECRRRLRENPEAEDSCWFKFNRVFDWLPVAAVVENRILCLHGGIGGSVHDIRDIYHITRPLQITQVPSNENEQIVTDILWSDPTDSDSILGVLANDIRDPEGVGHIVKFGPDRVHQFLADNHLQLIIRAHECVMDGFERFAGGKLITVFSATNYCNSHQNAGAFLFIKRDMTIVPKLIFPSKSELRAFNTWDYRMMETRPPTPPRVAPRMHERNFGAPDW